MKFTTLLVSIRFFKLLIIIVTWNVVKIYEIVLRTLEKYLTEFAFWIRTFLCMLTNIDFFLLKNFMVF